MLRHGSPVTETMRSEGEAGVPPRDRLTDIDVLRAIAILMVLLAHTPNLLVWPFPAWLAPLSTMFPVGVELFFAISGFVIGRSLLRDMEMASATGSWGRMVRRFWIRRAWRLLPAAYLWLIIPCILSAALYQYGWFETPESVLISALTAVLDVANLELAYRFTQKLFPGPTFHYWSLSLEEQFYFITPFILCVPRRIVRPVLLGIALLSCALVGSYASAFRVEELACGVMLASIAHGGLLPKMRWTKVMRFRGLMLIAAFLLLGALTYLSTIPPPYFGGWSPRYFIARVSIALCCTTLVQIASMDIGGIAARGHVYKFLLYIGRRSYSLYLAHVCSFLLIKEIFFRIGQHTGPDGYDVPIMIGVGWLFTGIAAELTYRYVEQRYRPQRRPLDSTGAVVAPLPAAG